MATFVFGLIFIAVGLLAFRWVPRQIDAENAVYGLDEAARPYRVFRAWRYAGSWVLIGFGVFGLVASFIY